MLTLAYSWANHLTQSLFYNKCWIPWDLLNTILEEEKRLVKMVLIAWPTESCGPSALPSITRDYRTVCCQHGKRTKFKVCFLNAYCFHTIIKIKNFKSNHCELGTITTMFCLSILLEDTCVIFTFRLDEKWCCKHCCTVSETLFAILSGYIPWLTGNSFV